MKKALLVFLFLAAFIGIVGCNGVTTDAPITALPTTVAPTTAVPTTAAPTTAGPTTAAPTTAGPTTAVPTTVAPTTVAPTTAQPTTAVPTTLVPTTQGPTTVPITTGEPTDTPPVISGADDVTIERGTAFIPLAGVTAYDAEDGDITSALSYSGNVNPNSVGVYQAIYTVIDSDGNIVSVERTVTVVFTDTQAPLISGAGNKTIYVGEEFNPLQGVSANDTVDGSVAVQVEGEVNIWVEGVYDLVYSASDSAENRSEITRKITVSFGDFIFGDDVTYESDQFTLETGIYSSPEISGGEINPNLAPFSYVRLTITVENLIGSIELGVDGLRANMTEIESQDDTEKTFVVYLVITEALTDYVFTLESSDETFDFSVDVAFAQIRDMVAPTLTVRNPEFSYPAGYSMDGLMAFLRKGVTAVDDIDGNLTSKIEIDLGTLDIDEVGTYEITYSVSDAGGNETVVRRNVIIANLVDSGYLSDPNFQNNGDGQWKPKSNDGQAVITYNPTEGTMIVTIDSLGGWASAAGAYIKEASSGFEVDQWYMFTFTVKSSVARKMTFRMGLETSQTLGWIDDFDGVSAGNKLNLTQEYVTYNFFFKLNSLVSSDGSTTFKIELNLGLVDYDYNAANSVVTFKDVYMHKLVTEFAPPTFERQYGEDLPVKLTVGDSLPDFSKYVLAKDMSQNVLVPSIDFSAVDMNTPGTYDVVYTVTDSHDLEAEYTLSIQVLSVENADTVAPVVTIKSGVPTSVDQFTQIQVDLRMLVDAVDAMDGVITVTSDMVDDGGLNFNVAGVYRVTYRVYDLSGNVGILEVDVTVNDKQAPSIGMNDQTINYGSSFDPRAGLVVNDNIDGIIDNAEVTITGLDQFMVGDKAMVAGVFDIVYTVSDAAGNEASKTVKIRVLDVIWDESSETTLGVPDEDPTHSTVEFDPVEQAYVISDIDINVDPWDHARWVYYFNDKDLEFGRTYKIVITAKATTATDLYFWIGTTLTVEPWIDSFSGTDKEKVTISDEYQTYEVIFTVNKENFNTIKSAKFQFMYGYLPTDTDNTIYIKEFNIVSDLQPTYTELEDLLGGHDELQAVTAVLDGGVLTLSDILVGNNPRLVYYFPNSLFTIDGVYRFVITVKADEARDLEFWIGSTLWEEPWVDTFDGGRQMISIGTEYVTYTVEFMMDKSTYFANGAKFQFQFGFVGDLSGNNIYINEFRLEKVEYPYIADFILVDDFGYADEDAFEAEWTQRTNTVDYNPSTYMNLDVEKGAMVFEMPTPVNNGWHIARKYDSLASFGVTDEYKYLAFYMTNNTTRDSAHIWLYYAGTQNSYAITLPAVGETGWAYIDVTVSGHQASAITDFGIGFNNWSSNPYIGDITVYFVCAVQNPDELAYITPVEEEEPKEIYYLVDDFVYEDEDAFEAEWTQRTNSTNVSPSELMNLDSENDAMIFAMPDVANGGWHMARKYDSLASFGVPDEYKYLAFYMTNNTNRTTAAVWLYYAGTQNSYAITLPPVGETGWAYVDVTASGHQVSGITDFGLGFNNWAGENQYVGSVTVIKIVMVEKPSDLIDVDVPIVVEPPLYHVVESFEYKDEDEFEAEWTQRTSGTNYNPGPRMNLDAGLEAMVFTLADPINNGWDLARKYTTLTALGVSDEMTHLAFYMTNNTDQTSIKVWFYWSGSQDNYTMTLPAIGETGWATIAFSVCGKLPSLITDIAIGFDNQSWSPAAGSYTIYEIGATDDPSKLDLIDVHIPEVTNNAPIVSISQANLAILSGLTLIDGEDITALLGSLLSMISIEDTEDGAIVATIEMVDLKGLNPANPIMGSYQIEIQTKDSDGLDSNVLTIPLSIVGILDDFDEYVDDADFKAEFPLYGFRSGSGWNVASGTLVVGDDNTLQLTYQSGTNGIRFNISKATLLSLGAEYIGIKITTSEVLSGTPKFQAFEYDSSGGYSELYGLQGMISATATGTYVFIPVSALKDTTASISILINVGAGNTGTMTLDNIVIK